MWTLAVVFFTACSDEENSVDNTDPFLPVAELDIPKQQLAGSEVTIYGKGFEQNCSIVLQLNGGAQFTVEMVEVREDRVVFKTGDLDAGFYVVILKQVDKSYRIGGLNLYKDELEPEDIEAYGIVAENGLDLYPVSVSKKIKGEKLFSLGSADHEYYGGVVIGEVYYYATYIVQWQEGTSKTWREFTIGYYDFRTGTQHLLQENMKGLVAMGNIEDEFYMIRRVDELYCLMKATDDGSFIEVSRFAAGGGELITINDGVFMYDKTRNMLVMGVYDMSKETQKLAWKLPLDYPELSTLGGTSDIQYHFVDCGGMIYVTGERVVDNDTGETEAYVFKPDDPTNWQFSSVSLLNKFKNAAFTAPSYNKEKEVIYGIDDNETVITYDVQKNQLVGGKWVNSGLYGLFVLNDN